MANVGECLAIAGQITAGDRDSWFAAWSEFADRLDAQGRAALASGHRASARWALLRAAEYYRQAFFFHRDDLGGDELTAPTGRASTPSGPRCPCWTTTPRC